MSFLWTPVRGRPGLVDDFEDGNLSEYTVVAGSWSITSSNPFDGTFAARTTDLNSVAISTSGLDNYPSAGDTFEWYARCGATDAAGGVSFGLTDRDNNIQAFIQEEKDNMQLKVRVNGQDVAAAQKNLPDGTFLNKYVRNEIDWGANGTITYTVEDVNGGQIGQLSVTDNTFTSGGIGLNGAPDGLSQDLRIDEIVII